MNTVDMIDSSVSGRTSAIEKGNPCESAVSAKRIAIVHPWFLMRGGGEKVVDVLAEMYPSADIYTLFVDPKALSTTLKQRRIHVSPLNALPFSSRFHFHMVPLYPWAIESFDLSSYDLILSSGAPVMMGVNPGQRALHICYCHTPPRAWWDQYAGQQARLSALIRPFYVLFASYIRMWEFSAVQRMDHLVANSHYVSNRVAKYFRRESTVIYPPVSTSRGYISSSHDDYYLTVGRLGRQKRVDLLIRACNVLGRRLVIAGTGREDAFLKSIAGPTIEFVGYVSDADLPALYANSRGFLFAADEDFGIAPVEAQSYGRPVIAFGHGGSLETVRSGDKGGSPDTGIFFSEQTVEAVVEAIRRFEARESMFAPTEIQQHACKFDVEVFRTRMQAFVSSALCQGEGPR